MSSDMFCLNVLPSVGEKRLVTLNVEASDNDLVSIHFFAEWGPRNCLVKTDSFSFNCTNSLPGL
jgi:hypothetical protein